MKILEMVYAMLARGFYRQALREIDPMHPDVGKLVIRERHHNDTLKRIFS